MTDNDIGKALECLCGGTFYCQDCICDPAEYPRCKERLAKKALDLINQLQAENERLNDGCSNCIVVQTKSEIICELREQIEYWQRGYNDLRQIIKTTKSEAIKEFAETVKDKQYGILRAHCNMDVICECDDCIDGLVKERTGEQK